MDHTCTTTDGTPIVPGLIVINNDLKPVKVVAPSLEREDVGCDGAGHGATNLPANCWWKCERPDGNSAGSFDGSRMVRRYQFREGLRTADQLWAEALA